MLLRPASHRNRYETQNTLPPGGKAPSLGAPVSGGVAGGVTIHAPLAQASKRSIERSASSMGSGLNGGASVGHRTVQRVVVVLASCSCERYQSSAPASTAMTHAIAAKTAVRGTVRASL